MSSCCKVPTALWYISGVSTSHASAALSSAAVKGSNLSGSYCKSTCQELACRLQKA